MKVMNKDKIKAWLDRKAEGNLIMEAELKTMMQEYGDDYFINDSHTAYEKCNEGKSLE